MNEKPEQIYMQRTLDLARRAEGRTRPNPMVGAVVVKNGRVVGEGYHKKAGKPHGEILALKKAGHLSRGADLYVNLEPCCHTGRTPPCIDAIERAGIRRVFIGMRDPNPLVRGKGIRALNRRGIKTVTGILHEECRQLNIAFEKYITTGQPYVILKSAISLDGKIATRTGESQWITGESARRKVHQLRDRVDAIMVGAGTVVKDNPRLTARLKKKRGRQPVRVILDNHHKVPLTARVFDNSEVETVIYAAGPGLPASRTKRLLQRGVRILKVREQRGRIDLGCLMDQLGNMELTSLLIEGGGEINASALREGLVDKIIFFVAPLLLGGKEAPGVLGGEGVRRLADGVRLNNVRWIQLGQDWMIEGTPE